MGGGLSEWATSQKDPVSGGQLANSQKDPFLYVQAMSKPKRLIIFFTAQDN